MPYLETIQDKKTLIRYFRCSFCGAEKLPYDYIIQELCHKGKGLEKEVEKNGEDRI